MKKDIKWLKERVYLLREYMVESFLYDKERPEGNAFHKGEIKALESTLDLINQLDEPEVLSQDLPVIPKFVADFIEVRKGTDAHSLKYILCVAVERGEQEECTKAYDWISANDETFARAWLDGFTVEEEPSYRVSAGSMAIGFWFLCKDNDGDIAIGTNKDYYEADWDSLKLTEQEIRDFDERYMVFAKPVEELEE